MFKKLFTYFKYIKILNENKDILEQTYGMKMDSIYRLHCVVSYTEDELIYGVEYMKKKRSDRLSDLSEFFLKLGILDLMKYEERYYDEYNTIIILTYKPLNISKLIQNILYVLGAILTMGIIYTILQID